MIQDTQFVERVRFFNGQRLFAQDLQSIEQFNREMRWLHNESLHQPGIGNGFDVTGSPGDREVTVGPGYAIDGLGREIVLNRAETLPVPPVSSDNGQTVLYDLVVSYPGDSDLAEVETREGVCLPRGAVRLQEAPIFCWVRLERSDTGQPDAKDPNLRQDILNHVRIRVARIEVLNCQLAKCASLAERGNARPDCRPYIAGGRLPLAGAEITPEQITQIEEGMQTVGFTIEVDTSVAGFVTTPAYNAHIEGPRLTKITDDGETFAAVATVHSVILDTGKDYFRLGVYGRMENVGSVELGPGETADTPPDLVSGRSPYSDGLLRRWNLVWMGVEA